MMKTHKTLAILSLSLLVAACNDDKKNENVYINFDTTALKNTYSIGETIDLGVSPSKEMTIDSVEYFIDDVKISSSKGVEKSSYTITDMKFGPKVLKSIAYVGGETFESSLQIKILPNIPNEEWTYTILNTYPHDTKAYTQGLEFYGDILIESTGNGVSAAGNKGKSSIRKVNPKTGEVLQITELDDSIFGEGATVFNNKIYQLTYQNNEGYVYNIETLTKEKTIPYFRQMEGWGLTTDGTYLYMTDGSDKIYKINADDFSKVDEIYVVSAQNTVPTVNELEWVNGKIYANFYGSNLVGVIDPSTGRVEAVINFSNLLSLLSNHPDQDVFNGIAYNKKTDTFFVTGKNWDKMFEVKINKN